MEKVKINTEYIKLDQFLKFVGLIGNGSDAKIIILQEEILVNGEVEIKRGRKLRIGDVVKVFEKEFVIE